MFLRFQYEKNPGKQAWVDHIFVKYISQKRVNNVDMKNNWIGIILDMLIRNLSVKHDK